MGKVVKTVAIGVGVAVAAVATAGAAIPALGAAFGLSAAVLGGIATASLVGVQYLMKPSAASAGANMPMIQGTQVGPAPTPLRRTLRQPDAPRCFIFGRTRTSGSYFIYETDTKKNLYQGIYICDGPIDGFDAILCDDEAFTPLNTGNGKTTDGYINLYIPKKTSDAYPGLKWVKDPNFTSSGTGSYWDGTKWVYYPTTSSGTYKTRECALVAYEPVNATLGGYNSYLLNTLISQDGYSIDSDTVTAGFQSNMSGIWSTSHLGKGITCLYTWASTDAAGGNANRIKYFPNGWPEWSVVMRGARMYDPRFDSTNGGSGSCRVTEGGVWTLYNSTWIFSENPAIIAAHYVKWLISQKLTAIVDVDWTSIAAAANDCDAVVSAKKNNYGDGNVIEPFAKLSAVFYFNTPPREFLSNLMAACDGSYGIDKDGKFTMWIGKWEAPEVTFTENDISSFTEEFVEPASEAVNEIHITYNEPRQGYQRFEAPVYIDSASQAQVGKKITTINFDMCPSPSQAYRLAARFAKRINGKRKLTLTVGPRGMMAIKQRVVDISAPNFGITQTTGVAWRVESLTPEMTLSKWTMTLREINTAVFTDPVPNDPVSSLKVINIAPLTAPQLVILNYQLTSSTTRTLYATVDTNYNSASNSIPNINEVALLQEQTLMLYVEYSYDNTTWSKFDGIISNSTVFKLNLNRAVYIYIRAKFISLNGDSSAWSSTITVIPI